MSKSNDTIPADSLDHCVNFWEGALDDEEDGTPASAQPIVIEVRGGVVQDVLNMPPGVEYEIRDHDDLGVA